MIKTSIRGSNPGGACNVIKSQVSRNGVEMTAGPHPVAGRANSPAIIPAAGICSRINVKAPARHGPGGASDGRAADRQLIVPQCSVQMANTAPGVYTFANSVWPSGLKHAPAHSLPV